MALKTLEPNPTWTAGAYEDIVDVFETHGDELVFKVWAGDWCPDCRSQLPDFAAALDAAAVPEANIEHYELNTDKEGPGVEEYGIEYIPTVVVERDGAELCRFVEEESVPIAVYLAERVTEELDSSA